MAVIGLSAAKRHKFEVYKDSTCFVRVNVVLSAHAVILSKPAALTLKM